MHCNEKKNLAESWHHLMNNVLKMAISDTVEYHELTTTIKQTELELTNCENQDYLPQRNRLHVWSLAKMGDYLYRQGLTSDALSFYIQAIKKDCDEPSVLNQIGVCLIQLQKLDRALYYFELLYRRASTFVDKALALFNCAVCYKLLGNFNEAIKLLRKSNKYVEDESTLKEIDKLKDLNSRQAFHGFMGKVFNNRAAMPKEHEFAPSDDNSKKFGG